MTNLTKEEKIAYYELFSKSLFEFAKYFLPHFLTSKTPEFHKEVYSMLPDVERLALASPRGHGKSTIISVIYPLWLALFQRRQDICIISASETLAVDLLRKIKMELESNPRIQYFFGDLKSSKWSEGHIILNNNNSVNLRAKGAGGQIRGFRPDVVLCDDIETDESVESEEQRKKLKNWLFKACLNTLLPGGQFVIIGTIIHPLSVLNDLLSADNKWVKKKYQAYLNGKQEKGNELWADLWNHDKLQQRKREIGTWAFASEYMNDPVADENAAIKDGMIRYWQELPTQLSVVIAVDPAYSEDPKADFKVASVIGIDQQMNRYLVHYLRNHNPTGDFIDGVLNLFLRFKGQITGLGIPCGGTEKEFYNSFLRRAEERKLYPPFVQLKNTFITQAGQSKRNKGSRIIAALQPLFESGKYYISPEHIEARDEILSITPNHLPRWDDIIDTMAYAEQILQPVFLEEETGQDYIERTYGKRNSVVNNYGMD